MRWMLVYISLVSLSAFADLDKDQRQGLKDTQELLRSPKDRAAAIAKDPKAKDIDDKAGALAGTPENKDEMYDIAAQLVEKIALQANGDPNKMQQLMIEAQKDPKAFYDKYFDDTQKAKVRGLANKIESNKPSIPGK
jgi:hypothetical protein